MTRLKSFLIEGWNLQPQSKTYSAMMEYRGDDYNTIVFMYLPKLDVFIHMESADGDVYRNKQKVGNIEETDLRHHQDLASVGLNGLSAFKDVDLQEMTDDDTILEFLEDDYDSVRGFCHKNDIYVYPVGGVNKWKSKAVLKIATYIDDYWWEK